MRYYLRYRIYDLFPLPHSNDSNYRNLLTHHVRIAQMKDREELRNDSLSAFEPGSLEAVISSPFFSLDVTFSYISLVFRYHPDFPARSGPPK